MVGHLGQVADESSAKSAPAPGRVDEHQELGGAPGAGGISRGSFVAGETGDAGSTTVGHQGQDAGALARTWCGEGSGPVGREVGQIQETPAFVGVQPTPECLYGGAVSCFDRFELDHATVSKGDLGGGWSLGRQIDPVRHRTPRSTNWASGPVGWRMPSRRSSRPS
jgi:hypothetical protein